MKKLWFTLVPLFLFPGLGFACEGDCGKSPWIIMDPKGPIATDEKHLILTAFGLMLIVVIPVIVMTFAFAWKYRASNKQASYTPKWDNSHAVEAVVWTVPAIIVLILSVLVWRSTHELTPEKPLASDVKPIVVEVVAMDWKWLFIYPEQGWRLSTGWSYQRGRHHFSHHIRFGHEFFFHTSVGRTDLCDGRDAN